jgi:hypothetical protein
VLQWISACSGTSAKTNPVFKRVSFTKKVETKQNEQGLVWFDLSTGMIDKIELTTQISGSVSSSILFHKESILPIRGIYN